MIRKKFPLSKVYQLLEPGPVVMVTTSYKGRANIMTMSWHMMIDFEPTLIGCVISNRNYSFKNLKKTKECVINIPTVELALKVVGVGNSSGEKIDKFKKFDLSQEPATHVQAPLITECYANLECKVTDMKLVARYNMFILEVVEAWVTPLAKRPRMIHHCGKGIFIVDGRVITFPSKKK